MKKFLFPAFLIAVALNLKLYSQNKILAKIDNIHSHEVKAEGFQLNHRQKVQISAVGIQKNRHKKIMFTRAWIINSMDREVVWKMEDAEAEPTKRSLLEFSDEIILEKGKYEVYYASFPSFYHSSSKFDSWLNNVLADIFDERRRGKPEYHFKKEWKKFGVTVRGKGRRFRDSELDELQAAFTKKSVVSLLGKRDLDNQEFTFKVKRDIQVDIYAQGEIRQDGSFDYGWIADLDNRQKIWSFDLANSIHGGGAKKNRKIKERITLPKGRYSAHYVTDDSHSPYQWNQAPPDDPAMWGLVINVAKPSNKKHFVPFIEKDADESELILDLTRLKNGEMKSKAFRCKKDIDVRVYAIGEGAHDEMYDYCWIRNTESHKTIWKMNFHQTEHAGGAAKNRISDNIISLNKGHYIAYCVTDDSHSYWEWNSAPPFDTEKWGLTIWAADKDFEKSDIELIDMHDMKSPNHLIQLVEMRNNERARKRFHLNSASRVRIYALGEGADGEMHDYGWIESIANNDVVWEMTYRKTSHAGGSRKNRLVDSSIMLAAGDYMLFYQTDDSHAFFDWNASPPYDPNSWGISLFIEK